VAKNSLNDQIYIQFVG